MNMDPSLLKQFGRVFTRQRVNLKVRLSIFTFFLIVASVLWFLNKLGYEYSTEITYPLQFDNIPRGKVFVGDPPNTIALRVRAHGHTLLRQRLSPTRTPIRINLNQIPLESLDNFASKFYLLTSRIQGTVDNQLKGELKLERIVPDQIHFEFAEIAERKVGVKTNVRYFFERQYKLSGPIKSTPDSIIINGPSSIIDTIDYVSTVNLVLDRLNSSEELRVDLVEINQVGFSNRSVKVKIPVEKFTEINFSKPIEIRNLPDTLRLILLPQSVNLKCNVILSRYRDISNEVEVFVDFLQAGTTSGNRLRVQVSTPKYSVSNLSFDPKFVEYYIEYQ